MTMPPEGVRLQPPDQAKMLRCHTPLHCHLQVITWQDQAHVHSDVAMLVHLHTLPARWSLYLHCLQSKPQHTTALPLQRSYSFK